MFCLFPASCLLRQIKRNMTVRTRTKMFRLEPPVPYGAECSKNRDRRKSIEPACLQSCSVLYTDCGSCRLFYKQTPS